MNKQNSWIAFGGGLAGALVLTAIHQYTKEKDEDAPRMDLLGMEALTKLLKKNDAPVPDEHNLYYLTMAGDILSNAVFYSAAGLGSEKTLLKATALGLAAGAGAVYLPKPAGLNEKHSTRTPETKALAVLYYLAGGIAAGASMKLLRRIGKKSVKDKVLAGG